MLDGLRPVFTGIKRRKMKPADAGRNRQAVREGGFSCRCISQTWRIIKA